MSRSTGLMPGTPDTDVSGIAVRRDQVRPASLERSRLPLWRTRYPFADDGKSNAAMPPEQLSSLAVHGSRRNVLPPSSEGRRAQEPPAITVSGPRRRRWFRSSESPVSRPDQLRPESVLFMSVPKSPDS